MAAMISSRCALSLLSRCVKGLVQKTSYASTSADALSKDIQTLDPHQVKLLDEMCILVDENDKSIGAKSKKECHLMENINKGMLHRAFSVFLFNTKGELLIQQRSDAKITFPGYFTNTCCSHPLHTPDEIEEKDALGVKRAALRRLEIELGISPLQISLSDFNYLMRFLYTAPSHGLWGEREIDYVLVLQKDVELNPNPNEIKSLHYIQRRDMPSFLESTVKRGEHITPWFKLIADSNLLYDLWDNLNNLKKLEDFKTIHRFT